MMAPTIKPRGERMRSFVRAILIALLLTSVVAPTLSCATQSKEHRDSAVSNFTFSSKEPPLATSNSPLPASLVDRSEPAPISPLPVATATVPDVLRWYTFLVVNSYRHDTNAHTQGLVFDHGWLYEGTGLNGRSTLRRVDLDTGVVNQVFQLPARFFGEGVAIFGDRIIQLTWKSNVGFVYDKDSFELLREFYYPTEGWGLAHDGEHLIMSDGTETLHFLDPETLTEIDQIDVYDDEGPVVRLNELEFVQGEIFANVWQTDRIARIQPSTGRVTGWIDLSGLLSLNEGEELPGVLNGIAYDADNDRLFVTGKLWPRLFEIKIVDVD